MAKIPVGKTIGFAYTFTFGHLGAIIALIWLPTIAAALLGLIPQLLGMPAQSILAPDVPLAFRLWGVGIIITSLVFSLMSYQAVTELALGLRQPGANFYFSLAPPLWRLFGAFLLFLLLLVLLGVILVVAVLLVGMAGVAVIGKSAVGIAMLLMLPFTTGFMWLVVFRIGFLLVPVTVAEGRIDLARSWTLTHGNFWRMFAVALAIWVPLIMLLAVGFALSLGSDLSVFMASAQDNSAQANLARAALLQRHMPMLVGLNLLFMPFMAGLGMGATSFAYRALTPPIDVFA